MSAATAAAYRPRVTVVEPDAKVVWVMTKFKRRIRGTGRRLAPDDPQFWPDLVQGGEIALWEAPQWRLDLAEAND